MQKISPLALNPWIWQTFGFSLLFGHSKENTLVHGQSQNWRQKLLAYRAEES